MAVHATTAVEATAEVDLWVHRDAMGDLESGVRGVLADVDGVRSADVTGVSDVTPRATDIRVTATARVVLDEEPVEADAVGATLADGFGVMDAAVRAVERTDA
ncbi:MAG: hypothetical protein ABEJ40_10160 [Haloarculaceae archaeon]